MSDHSSEGLGRQSFGSKSHSSPRKASGRSGQRKQRKSSTFTGQDEQIFEMPEQSESDQYLQLPGGNRQSTGKSTKSSRMQTHTAKVKLPNVKKPNPTLLKKFESDHLGRLHQPDKQRGFKTPITTKRPEPVLPNTKKPR